jgi:hypothetical protein
MDSADGDFWGLCTSHADSLGVPLGWAFVDRREEALAARLGPSAAPPLCSAPDEDDPYRELARVSPAGRADEERSAPDYPAVAI